MQTNNNGKWKAAAGGSVIAGLIFFESLRVFLTDYQQLKIVQGEGVLTS